MSKTTYTRPVIPLLVCLISGIIIGNAFPHHHPWAYFLIIIAVLLTLNNFLKNKNGWCSPVILFIASGYLSIQPWTAPKFSDHHIIHYTDSHTRQITGIVDSPPIEKKNRKRFVLKTNILSENSASFPVSGKISISIWGKSPELAVGGRISFISKIKPIRNFNNPGRFDFKRYMHFKKVWGIAHVPAS
ncbi:ComEC/Rec2 family competence protein [Thermodesulfobacteriota bacterium]